MRFASRGLSPIRSAVLLSFFVATAALGACAEDEAPKIDATGSGGSGAASAGSAGAQASAGNAGSAAGMTAGGAAGAPTGGAAGASSAGAGGSFAATCAGATDPSCNDGNPCTTDTCEGSVCVFAPVLPGTACDLGGDLCYGAARCEGAVCKPVPGSAVATDDDDPCTDDVCDPKTGIVTHAPKVKATDSTLCTLVVCDPKTGAKVAKDLSDDGDLCTFDECDIGVGPINTRKPVGDGDPCTIDTCNPQTGKIEHTLAVDCAKCLDDAVCDDGNPCTKDTCGAVGCESSPFPNGQPCDNGNACDGVAVCKVGKCVAGTPVAVSDDNPCTKDTCDPQTGNVTHTPIPSCQP